MRLGLPLSSVSYWDASVLLGNGPEGDFTWASGANTLPQPVGQRGHPHVAQLLAPFYLLLDSYSTGLSLPSLPSGHRFLSAASESFASASTFSPAG